MAISAESIYEKVSIGSFAEQAYLDYAMFVVLDRALPHVSDGLKPVQRRIVYAMSLLHLDAKAKHKKSVRTVGDVVGKFHPHGDGACYEAMVLMAQSFSFRYPLIDGQGNWGSIDNPKSFAAMRYTEARLTNYAQNLLAEVGLGTVDWGANFDGTFQEPLYLPAQLPNVLLNGATGIAVGMTCDIPPHNCKEVVDASIYLLNNPDATFEDIHKIIPGPDYPTGAECVSSVGDLSQMYRSGQGSVLLRATYFVEDKKNIVINSLPYRVSPNKVMEQIAEQMQKKSLPSVVDLRDESDHENPVRLVVSLKTPRADVSAIMDHLFVTTDLEKSDKVVFNIIGLDRKPRVFSLLELLKTWVGFRKDVVVKRVTARLKKVDERLHLLDGLLLIYDNLDAVIEIIRKSEDPKQELMMRFSLSLTQVEAILEIRLRSLAKLVQEKLIEEKVSLEKEKKYLEGVLKKKGALVKLISQELRDAASLYSDERRTALVQRAKAQRLQAPGVVKSVEDITVVLSEHGWVRGGKTQSFDLSKIVFRTGDKALCVSSGRSDQEFVVFSSCGRCFTIKLDMIPAFRTQGDPITKFIDAKQKITCLNALVGSPLDKVLFVGSDGYGFTSNFEDCTSKTRSGKQVCSFSEGVTLTKPVFINEKSKFLVLVSLQGRMLILSIEELVYLKKGKGQKLLQILPMDFKEGQDSLAFVEQIEADDKFKVIVGKRSFNLKPETWAGYVTTRAKRGKFLPQGFRNVSSIEVVVKKCIEVDV